MRLPGQFVSPINDPELNPKDYVHRLKRIMGQIAPTPTRPHTRHVQIHKDLSSCTHVFVRCDHVLKPLDPPYRGPYRVLDRTDKFYKLDMDGKCDTVSLDRLKVAYLDDSPAHSPPMPHPSVATSIPSWLTPTETVPLDQSVKPQKTTRSGRRVHWPAHLTQYDCD